MPGAENAAVADENTSSRPATEGYDSLIGEFLATLAREMPPDPHVTLVALTGWGQDDDRRRALTAGFDHHLVKPAQLEALQSVLNSIPSRAA